ncbi:lipid-A-disaccharide synthetase family protein, partial [Vibrio parahaemolyticus V-223/04]
GKTITYWHHCWRVIW